MKTDSLTPYPTRASTFKVFSSIIFDGQVFVFYRGELLLKKWLRYPPGQSRIFNKPGNF